MGPHSSPSLPPRHALNAVVESLQGLPTAIFARLDLGRKERVRKLTTVVTLYRTGFDAVNALRLAIKKNKTQGDGTDGPAATPALAADS